MPATSGVREAGVIVSQAVLIAIAVDGEGRRQVLAIELANRESRSSWRDLLLGLKRRGLFGVEFVVSDDHPGLKQAIREVLPEAAWQRCYVGLLKEPTKPDSLVVATSVGRFDAGQQGAGSVRVLDGRLVARSDPRRSRSRSCGSSPRPFMAACRSAEALCRGRHGAARHRPGGGNPADAGRFSARDRARPQADARGAGQSRHSVVRGLWSA